MAIIKLSTHITDPTMSSKTPFLVIDDSDSARDLVVSSLRSLGFDGEIHAVSNLDDAVTVIQTKNVHFILCDWQLENGREGVELLKVVRMESPDVPFIMITSLDEVENILDALKIGASEYLVKPCSPEDLKQKLLGALRHHIK